MPKCWLIVAGLALVASSLFAQDGLVAYYPFDGSAEDLSVNGNHPQVDGPVLTPDRFGRAENAYVFDGIDDLMRIPFNPSLYPPNLGVALWVKLNEAPEHGKFLMTNSGDFATPPYDPFRLRLRLSRKISSRFEGELDSLQLILESSTVLDVGKWYFIATYYNSNTGEAALFINGRLEDKIIEPLTLDTNELGMLLGASQDHLGEQDSTAYFAGCLDDIRIFNRGLTAREIEAFFLEGSPSTSKVDELKQNFPNPFNPETTITYVLSSAAHVRVNVYNIRGQEVRSLLDESQPRGTHSVRWDGNDKAGREVSSGVYVYRVRAGGQGRSRKMLLIK